MKTLHLTDQERHLLVPILVSGLKKAKTLDNAVSKKSILEKLADLGSYITSFKLDVLLQHIQETGLVQNLIVTPLICYSTDDLYEFEQYLRILKEEQNRLEIMLNSVERQKQNLI